MPAYDFNRSTTPLNTVRRLARLEGKAVRALVRYRSEKEAHGATTAPSIHQGHWNHEVGAQQLSQLLATTLSVRDAADSLGCASTYVRELIRAGLLAATTCPSRPNSPRISPKEVRRFTGQLVARAVLISTVQSATVALSCVPANRLWRTLLESIVAGRISLFHLGCRRDLTSLRVATRDLRKVGFMEHAILRARLTERGRVSS